MDEGAIEVDPLGRGVLSIETSATKEGPLSPHPTEPPKQEQEQEQVTCIESVLLSLDELALDTPPPASSPSLPPSSVTIQSHLVSETNHHQPVQPVQPPLSTNQTTNQTNQTTNLKRQNAQLVAAVAALQRAVASANLKLERIDDDHRKTAAIWERDANEFEENKCRVALLETDLDIINTENKKLSTLLNEAQLQNIALKNTVHALEGELSLYAGTGELRRDHDVSVVTPINHIDSSVIQELTAKIQSLESQLASANDAVHIAETNSKDMTEVVLVANKENERITSLLTVQESRVTHLTQEVHSLQQSLATATSKATSLTKENTSLLTKLTALSHPPSSTPSISNTHLEERIQTLEQDLTLTISEKLVLESQVDELTLSLSKTTQSLSHTDRELRDHIHTKELLEVQLNDANRRIQDLEESLETAGREKHGLEVEGLRVRDVETERMRVVVESVTADLKVLQSENTILKNQLREREDLLNSSQQNHERGITDLEHRLSLMQEKLDRSTSDATRSRNAYDSETRNLNDLVKKLSADLTASQVTVENLEKDIEVIRVENIRCMEQLKEREEQLLRLQQELTRMSSLAESGSRVEFLQKELDRLISDSVRARTSYDSETRNLNNLVKKLTADLTTSQVTVETLEKDLETTRSELTKRNQLLVEREDQLVRVQQELGRRSSISNDADHRVEVLQKELDRVSSDASRSRVSYDAEMGKLNDLVRKLTTDLTASQYTVISLEKELESARNRIQEHSMELERLQKEQSVAESTDELKTRIQQLTAEVTELQDNCIEFADVNQVLEDQVLELKNSVFELKSEKASLGKSLEDVTVKVSELENDVVQLEHIIRDCLSYLVPQDSELMGQLYRGPCGRNRNWYFSSIKDALDLVRHHGNLIQQVLERNRGWIGCPPHPASISVSFVTIQACLEHLETLLQDSKRASTTDEIVSQYVTSPIQMPHQTLTKTSPTKQSHQETFRPTSRISRHSSTISSPSQTHPSSTHIQDLHQDLHQTRQEIHRLHTHISSLQTTLTSLHSQTTRDAHQITFLTLELETHKRTAQDTAHLLARIKSVEEQTAVRVRELEGREDAYRRDVEVLSREVEEWRRREGVWSESASALEDALVQAARELNFGGTGGGGGRRDELFEEILGRLEGQRVVSDGLLVERGRRLVELEREVEVLREIENKVHFLELNVWELVNLVCGNAEILDIGHAMGELKAAVHYYMAMNERLMVWRSDLVFQKRFLELKVADLMESERLLLLQVSGGSIRSGEIVLEVTAKRRWKRAGLVVIGALRFGLRTQY
ncbi:hypothetical protein HDU79_009597 [Rhizoclosmatium sp. JEL0117]|nr:hypothetical protein HDU79_009597 [Rhizoclosmatium sp. JEL0117]